MKKGKSASKKPSPSRLVSVTLEIVTSVSLPTLKRALWWNDVISLSDQMFWVKQAQVNVMRDKSHPER